MISVALAVLKTEGEQIELSNFYSLYSKRLYAIAYSKLHDRQDAEDAVQELFLRLADKPEKFFLLVDNKRVAYADVIIRNISIDAFNARNKVTVTELSEEISADEFGVSLEDNVLGEISKSELLNFIETLPQLQQDVLTLHSMLELSNAEIANSLHISEIAVRQRLFLARESILDYIKNRK